jgi:methionyl-tRNA synthetase
VVGNQGLNGTAAARAVYVALRAIDSLKILFAPFLPHTSERLHTFFGNTAPLFGTQKVETIHDNLGEHRALMYDGSAATGKWQPSQIQPGQALNQPAPLFKKLDVKIVEEERARLGHPA